MVFPRRPLVVPLRAHPYQSPADFSTSTAGPAGGARSFRAAEAAERGGRRSSGREGHPVLPCLRLNRVTLASIGFLFLAIALSAWLLMRPRAAVDPGDAPAAGVDPAVGLTFAEWSVRSDGVLLADIEPGTSAGAASTTPRSFLYLPVKRTLDGKVEVLPGRPFSWAPDARKESAEALFALGFRVSTDGRAFTPPDDPFWSDPIPRVDGGTTQVVTMREKGSLGGGGGGAGTRTVRFERHREDAKTTANWGRRAIGFLSGDGHMLYVTPDARVISADAP